MKKRVKNNLGSIIHRMAKEGKNFQNFGGKQHIVGAEMVSVGEQMPAMRTPLVTPVSDFRAPSSAATFDLLISRPTNNTGIVLPIPLFGVLDNESDWTEIISQYLPSGVTYAVSRGADRKSLDFAFTNGLGTDTINLSCNQVPYVNLLISGLDSVFKMQQNKISINNVANVGQFSQSIGIFNRSFFGHAESDSITPEQYKTDMQNQNDIRVINQILDIDKQRTLLVKVLNAENHLITISSFIMKYDKGVMSGSM